MQPERTPTEWQQPNEQPSQSPYVTSAEVPGEQPGAPVVTLTPDTQPVSVQPTPAAIAQQGTVDSVDDDVELLHWQAKEYIQRDKSLVWFVVFGIVFLAVMAASIFLIKSMTFNVLVPIMAVSLLMYVYRPPRMLNYTLSRKGVYINDQLYPYSEFKTFGVIQDEGEYSIMLVPAKRFKPGVTVFFPEQVGEELVDMIGARLPIKEIKLDLVDRLIRKLRI